jgi:hypothetical protein
MWDSIRRRLMSASHRQPFAPGQVVLHPGPSNQPSVVRCTAPTAGTYQLTCGFDMRSTGGTHSTDAHVILNNTILGQLFNGTVDSFDDFKSFNTTLTRNVDDVVDVVDVVVGPNGTAIGQSYLGDTTELNARFESLPHLVDEPGTLLMVAVGIGLLGGAKRRDLSRVVTAA